MQVCSDSYEPKRTTAPITPRGPTFTLGSLAADGTIYGEPTTTVEFAQAKNAAALAQSRVARATSISEITKILNNAVAELERALTGPRKRSESQSLQARLSNLRRVAMVRERELVVKRTEALRESANRELDLTESQFTDLRLLDYDDHASSTYQTKLTDGSVAYFKPTDGFESGWRDSIPTGSEWRREVAAYQVDRLANLNLVPITVAKEDSQLGLAGSLQVEAPGEPEFNYLEYSEKDRESAAVLDYIIGNTDRHLGNFRSFEDGHLAAIDHGYSFPVDESEPVRSSFVADMLGKDISEAIMTHLRRVNPDEVRETLEALEIEAPAIEGTLRRLREVQDSGRITGQAWDGGIQDALYNTIVQSCYS
jgi:hypothetical protein